MKQPMKWILINEQENYVVFRCSVCNSEITVKYGEELPYCKHCESEPDGEQFAMKYGYDVTSLVELLQEVKNGLFSTKHRAVIGMVEDILIDQERAIKNLKNNNKQLTNDVLQLSRWLKTIDKMYQKEVSSLEKWLKSEDDR